MSAVRRAVSQSVHRGGRDADMWEMRRGACASGGGEDGGGGEAIVSPQAQAIVEFLDRRGQMGATNVELAAIPGHFCQRFGARIWEAKREGYAFGKRNLRPGLFRYWLTGKPQRTGEAR